MASPTTFPGDIYVPGTLVCNGLTPPNGFLTDIHVNAGAAIDHLKMIHQHRGDAVQSGTSVTETRPVGVIYGASGTVLSAKVGSVVANIGAATVVVDVKKNGTTILTGTVTLNSSNVAYVAVSGTLVASPTLVAGDVLTATFTATAGGGTLATGVFVEVRWKETAI